MKSLAKFWFGAAMGVAAIILIWLMGGGAQKLLSLDRVASGDALLVLVALLQVVLFYVQLKYMRASISEASRAAIAAEESATIAKRTVEAIENNAERELRAYIGVSVKSLATTDDGRLLYKFSLYNYGKTPAKNVRTFGTAWIFEHPLASETDLGLNSIVDTEDTIRTTLFPSTESLSDHEWRFHPAQMAELSRDPSRCLYFIGTVKYDDYLSRPRSTEYCAYIPPPELAMVAATFMSPKPGPVTVIPRRANRYNNWT